MWIRVIDIYVWEFVIWSMVPDILVTATEHIDMFSGNLSEAKQTRMNPGLLQDASHLCPRTDSGSGAENI